MAYGQLRKVEYDQKQVRSTPFNVTPDANGYHDGYEAQTRARAHYEYDGAGRLTWLGHYWDTLGTGNTYTSQAIVGQYCDYESNGTNSLNRGVKTDAVYKTAATPGSASWTTSQTDTYGYDAQLDYLTAASYGDGLANASPTWSYDAAGNRNDAVTDNLNRATSLGGTTVTNDILGNRITNGSTTCGWDILNRMTSFTSSSGVTNYVYRADGMRVSKSNSTGSTSYRYDGQMGMEDIDFASNGTVSKVTDYGIGPRGVDAMYVTQSSSTSTSYPLYDAHGNMISTLTKQGVGGFAYSALRTFDAWGLIRRGAQTGDPKGRYCASLGHKQDDESGLVYMRARYYEPSAGRFICEDPKMSGHNWFGYANGDPVSNSDFTGNEPLAGPIVDLIKEYLKSMGIEIKDLNNPSQILIAVLDCAVHIGEYIGAANISACFSQWGLAGFGTGTVIGNPFIAGLCGVAIIGGMMGDALCGMGIVLALRNTALEIYTIEAMDPE